MCDLTLLSILREVCSFTAWFIIKNIKNDHKIQDMGEEMYIFI